MLGTLGLSDDEISPESYLFDSIVGLQLLEVGLDEVLGEGRDQLGVLADGLDVSEGLNSDGIVLVAAFVESHDDLPLEVIADRHFALAAVPLLLLGALDDLIKHQLLHLFALLQSADDLRVSEELPVVVLQYTIEILSLTLQLFRVIQGMQGFNDIFDLCVFDLLKLFRGCNELPLLGRSLNLFNGEELLLRELHSFLQCFGFDPLVLRVLGVELLGRYGRAEPDYEEGLAFLLQKMGEISVFSEIFAEIFIA